MTNADTTNRLNELEKSLKELRQELADFKGKATKRINMHNSTIGDQNNFFHSLIKALGIVIKQPLPNQLSWSLDTNTKNPGILARMALLIDKHVSNKTDSGIILPK